jgi:hypothetical protein
MAVGRDSTNNKYLLPKQDQDEKGFANLDEEQIQSGMYLFIDIQSDETGILREN